MSATSSFTGRRRFRKTRWTVRVADRVARAAIAVGGVGTILAVLLVCVFLAWVAAPLFLPATVEKTNEIASPWSSSQPLHVAVDEYRIAGWALLPDGTLYGFRLDDGHVFQKRRLFASPALTASSFQGENAAFGFADGTARAGAIGFRTTFLEAGQVPKQIRADLESGRAQVAEFDGGLLQRTPEGQFRGQKLAVDLQDPIRLYPAGKSPVVLIDHVMRDTGSGPVFSFGTMTKDGRVAIRCAQREENLMTGEVTTQLTGAELALPPSTEGLPNRLLLNDNVSQVFVAWPSGRLVRYDTRDLNDPKLVEEQNLTGDREITLRALEFMLGRTTLVSGDSSGRVRAWSLVASGVNLIGDRSTLTATHEFPGSGAPVTSLAASTRDRTLAVGYADGTVRLYYLTSERLLAEVRVDEAKPVSTLALAPKNDGLTAGTSTSICAWDFDARYPEATLSALWRPVWYEGADKPRHVWQSSSGTDRFESKFGLVPLVFGTLKATFYSLLLGVPLALLAAVYTSEFLHPRTKAKVKPMIEMMASLPSVVLGFLAALVFAPVVEEIIPAILAWFVTVPCALLAGAHLWQSLPPRWALRVDRMRLPVICVVLPLGVMAGFALGPGLERILFAGDIKAWLNFRVGGAIGGWMVLFTPASAVGVAWLFATRVGPWMRRLTADWGRLRGALLEWGILFAGLAATLGVALFLSCFWASLRFDPRGLYLGTYDQRNALIVGFVMGFAIIPIVYTIADDALSTVPDHLRAASLGAGATRWQTATRIVVPTAMSGLFSAVMIGLGRAVGETMIVLMAAGNTPIMEWNVFNGFRTLSANIAVEMPEAVRNSTHYRVLFVAALTLFAMTFVVNTFAEVVRQRFRRRAFEL
jgi:phosphate transport system permease protein